MRTLWGLKLDMAKAYNPMEWDFLGIALEAFGFYEEFIKINLECISYVFFSILLYGSSFGLATPQKNLDPLFFVFFFLGVNVLSQMLLKEKEKSDTWSQSP